MLRYVILDKSHDAIKSTHIFCVDVIMLQCYVV